MVPPFSETGSVDGGPGFEGKRMNLVLNMLCLEVPLGHLGRDVQ